MAVGPATLMLFETLLSALSMCSSAEELAYPNVNDCACCGLRPYYPESKAEKPLKPPQDHCWMTWHRVIDAGSHERSLDSVICCVHLPVPHHVCGHSRQHEMEYSDVGISRQPGCRRSQPQNIPIVSMPQPVRSAQPSQDNSWILATCHRVQRRAVRDQQAPYDT